MSGFHQISGTILIKNPALALLCSSLCGTLAKKFGDP